MCGIIGIISEFKDDVTYDVLEGLLCLQHRGQDSSGISNGTHCIKDRGYAINIFNNDNLKYLRKNLSIGHVRYATTKTNNKNQLQPFNIKLKYSVTLVHNGNIINVDEIKKILKNEYDYITNTTSDSELILQLFISKLYNYEKNNIEINKEIIFCVIAYLQDILIGSFSILMIIEDICFICFRDRYGIRPIQYGYDKETKSHMFSSESGIYNILNYKYVRDVQPGEIIYISTNTYQLTSKINNTTYLIPCIFEYLYFARSDSYINNISVYAARSKMGELLGTKIKKIQQEENLIIDCIVPVPDTSRIFAKGVQNVLNIPYHEALVKNRYIDRTFILESENEIKTSIKRKFTTIDYLIKDKNVLIVDDSIVRGNTSKHIVNILKRVGVKKIYIASASPPVMYSNNFGIFIQSSSECIAYNKSYSEIENILGIDKIIYNNLDEIIDLLKTLNNNIVDFETSMFDNRLCYKTYL